jgi:hypothetical protein
MILKSAAQTVKEFLASEDFKEISEKYDGIFSVADVRRFARKNGFDIEMVTAQRAIGDSDLCVRYPYGNKKGGVQSPMDNHYITKPKSTDVQVIEDEPVEDEPEYQTFRQLKRKPDDRLYKSNFADTCFACWEDGKITAIKPGDFIVWYKESSGVTRRNSLHHYSIEL